MIEIDNLILGAGIAGLAVGIRLSELGGRYLIVEQNDDYGGLCRSFNIEGFDFDYFVHQSFTKDDLVRHYFDQTPYISKSPDPYNYYHGKWIKHPAQNNLYPLSKKEKLQVLYGLKHRNRYADVSHDDYEHWLRYQFGDYFAEHFSLTYTKKYWQTEARDMETQWVGDRIYQPTMEEIIDGMKTENTPVTYYAKEMRYPRQGGYQAFLRPIADKKHIRLNEKVISIDLKAHEVVTDRDCYTYRHLYSSIPLTELINIISDDESESYKDFVQAVKNLHWTSGYIISLGFKGQIPRHEVWDYIYDEDIAVTRYYSPSTMSDGGAAPDGCYSLQAEIYTRDGQYRNQSNAEILEQAIVDLDRIGAIKSSELIVKNIRFAKYCNVIFDNNIYKNREIALKYLISNEMKTIGRFGEWDYLWSDQSFLSGYNAVED